MNSFKVPMWFDYTLHITTAPTRTHPHRQTDLVFFLWVFEHTLSIPIFREEEAVKLLTSFTYFTDIADEIYVVHLFVLLGPARYADTVTWWVMSFQASTWKAHVEPRSSACNRVKDRVSKCNRTGWRHCTWLALVAAEPGLIHRPGILGLSAL